MPVRANKRFGLRSAAAAAQAAARTPPAVAITELDAWAVRASPSSSPRLVVAVRASEGLTGYGETSGGRDPRTAAQRLLSYSEVLEGRDALASEAVRGVLSEAPPEVRGAIDIALLDLRGKIAGAPVYDLLAGRTRDKARAMAALSGAAEPALMEQVAAARSEGFRAFSVPLSMPLDVPTRGRAFFASTEAMLTRLREGGADDIVLDCSGQATAAEAAGLAARLERFHLMWIDEPTSEISDEALRKISHESVTPVGWGRHLLSGDRFQDFLRLQVVDVVRPDLGLHGISGTRKIAALAEAYYTAVAPFHRGGPIGTAAALQVAASVPNFVVQEIAYAADDAEGQMDEAIFGGSQPRVADGFFELPSGPGLGIEVDENALREYAA